jgi:hypothetical protein
MSRFLSFHPGAAANDVSPYLDVATPPRRRLPSIVAVGPAFLLLASVVVLVRTPYIPATAPPSLLTLRARPEVVTDGGIATGTVVSDADLIAMAERGVWPLSQTLVVQPAVASARAAAFWSARLAAMPPVRGKAPLAGQVARVMVQPGQRVSVGDPILELSTGTEAPAKNSPAEKRQNAAESAQVRAAKQQEELQQKMHAAQTQLTAAQERVERAQKRVEEARDIVRRLQRGEIVARPQGNKAPVHAAQKTPGREESVRISVRLKALAQAQVAEKSARTAQRAASAAEREAQSLEAAAKTAESALKAARAAVAVAQKGFDAGEVKASELDAARAAAEDAEGAHKTALANSEKARKRFAERTEAARTAQTAAQKAASEAAATIQGGSIFGGDTSKVAEPAVPADATENALSVDDAARMARAALAESEIAVAETRRLKSRIDTYSRQVNTTRTDLDKSSHQLADAQDAVLDQTIRTNLSVVRAPASGVVESTAKVALSVQPGDIVVAIGRRDRLQIAWTDHSGAWRALREEGRIPVQINTSGGIRAATARIDEINEQAGGARIEAVLDNPQAGGAPLWQEGLEVQVAMPSSIGKTPTSANTAETVIPVSSLKSTGAAGNAEVAVLVPLVRNEHTNAETTGEVVVRVEWRRVQVLSRGAEDARVSGLRRGERIALRALLPSNDGDALQLVA